MKVLVGLAFETNAQDYGLLIMRVGYTNLMHPPDVMQVRQGIPIHKRAYEIDDDRCAIGSHERTAIPFVCAKVHSVAWAESIKGTMNCRFSPVRLLLSSCIKGIPSLPYRVYTGFTDYCCSQSTPETTYAQAKLFLVDAL